MICAAEFIFLVWVLYRLLGGVNKTHASLMVSLGLVFVPFMLANTLNEIAALLLLRGADFLSVFDKRQLEAMAMLCLDLHRYGYVVGWILGFWLFPFGLLVFRSGFLPRILGVLLITAGFGYLADSLTPLLLPSYEVVVGPDCEHSVNVGGTRDHLVAFDCGSEGSTIGDLHKVAILLALDSRAGIPGGLSAIGNFGFVVSMLPAIRSEFRFEHRRRFASSSMTRLSAMADFPSACISPPCAPTKKWPRKGL